MISDLSKFLNKSLTLTLVNGIQKNGTLVSIDLDENTVRIKDEVGNPISVLISLIGMVEPYSVINLPREVENKVIPVAEVNREVKQQKLNEIVSRYSTTDSDSRLILRQPALSVPFEINALGRNSNEMKIWNLILNKFADGKKNKKLEAKSETLKSILKNLDELKTLPKLYKSPSLNELLAYFHFLNNDLDQSFQYCRRSVVFNFSQNNLYNLSINARLLGKYEIEFIAIDKFLSYSDELTKDNIGVWIRYINLIKEFSASSVAKNLSAQRQTFKKIGLLLIEGLAYLLSANGKSNEATDILEYLDKEIEDYQLINSFRNFLDTKTSDKLILAINSFEEQSRLIKNEILNSVGKEPVFEKLKLHIHKPKVEDTFKKARYERDYKNFELARELFINGIESEIDINIKERAVRDLASMLAQQMNLPGEAIKVINQYQSSLSDADLNLLYNFYYQLEEYNEAIMVMKRLLMNTSRRELRINRISLIAGGYLRINKFAEAAQSFKDAIILDPTNIVLKRNYAICLIKQNKIAEARRKLQEIIEEWGDSISIKLLENLDINELPPDKYISIDAAGFLDRGLDTFTEHFLKHCELTYVDKSKLSVDGKYIGSEDESSKDIKKLEDTASKLASKIAEGRSNIYFNAAKIVFDLGKTETDLYKYLCRAFASKGDNAVQVRNHIDTVRSYYLASLKVYDKIYLDMESNTRSDEQDAVNALCRSFFALISREQIPLTINGKNLSIKQSIETVFPIIKDSVVFFDAVLIILTRAPQFVLSSLIPSLYKNESINNMSLEYLLIQKTVTSTEYSAIWKARAKSFIKMENEISNKLSHLIPFQMTEIWLYSSLEKINEVLSKLFFESDRDTLHELCKIFDISLTLSKSISFDDKIRRAEEISSSVSTLQKNIEDNPTKFSIEEVLPILNAVDLSITDYLNNLFMISKPQFMIQSAYNIYQIKDNLLIDTQIKVENISEGHAEQVEISIKDIEMDYTVLNTNINFGTIRGKSQKIEIVTLKLSQSVIEQKAFTLKILAKYKYIDNQIYTSEEQEVSIQIGNPEDFIPATNKFATYAESAEVKEKEMFFGRDNIITSIYESVCNHYKSFVFYGQKRAGKSSILYHAEQQLKNNSNILVANIGNIGSVIDSNSKVPLLYQILYDIINKIEYSVEDKIFDGLPELEFSFPDDITFYAHPSPLQKFRNLIKEFLRELSKYPEWSAMKIVVLIDEFTYIYHLIMQGKLSQDFMINWKAILQENFFSVVLVAQDFYPKFRAYDPNAFQTMQSERISYLREPDARKLIDEPIMIDGESRYAENAIDRIVELTAGSPFYIQIFCDKLVDYVNEEKVIRITEANVNKVLREKLLTLDKSVFDNLINDGDSSSDAILQSDAEIVLREIAKLTKNQPFCDSAYMNVPTKSSLTEILQNLVQREVVEVNKDGYYKIKVDLFKEWLINNPI